MTTECLTEHELDAFLSHAADVELRERVEVHVAECDECREVLAVLARSDSSQSESSIDQRPTRDTPSFALAMTERPADSLTSIEDDEPVDRSGARVGRFVLLEMLGAGGMGVVYAAYDPDLDRKIAVKLVRPRDAGQPEATRRDARARMLREARALARVSHPNVVPVHEVGTVGDEVFIAMEYLPGGSLRHWLARESPPSSEILARFLEAGEGLAAVHAANLTHRDFKPDNILIGAEGHARVADFGLASASPTTRSDLPSGDSSTTHALVGTPAYMAPELRSGRAATPSSDQYSFCVSLWEAIAGERPGAEHHAGMRLPPWLRPLLERGLQDDPDARFETMDALLVMLRRSSQTSKRRPAGIALVGLAAATAFAWFAMPADDRCASATAEGAELLERLARFGDDVEAAGYDGPTEPLVADLTSFGRAWETHWLDACRATERVQSAASLDRRMSCLTRQRYFVDALTARAWSSGHDLVDAVAALPDPDACSGARLERTALLPEDPRRRAAAQRAQRRIADARLESFREVEPAVVEIRAAQSLALASGHEPTIADALRVEATLTRRTAPRRARQVTEQALLASIRGTDDYGVAHAWIELAWSETLEGEYERAVVAGERAAAVLSGLSDDPFLSAKLASVQGAVARHRGQFGLAESKDREAWTIMRDQYGADDTRTIIHALNLVGDLAHGGKPEEALPIVEQANEVLDSFLPPHHHMRIQAHQTLGIVLHELARYERSLEVSDALIALLSSSEAPSATLLAMEHHNRGAALMELGRLDEAIAAYRRSIEMLSDHPQDTTRWRFYVNLGEAHWRADRADEALTAWREALRLGRALAPEHPFLRDVEQWVIEAEAVEPSRPNAG